MIGSLKQNRLCSHVVGVLIAMIGLAGPVATHCSAVEPARVGEPYELLGNRLVFTNWIYVRPGDVGWVDKTGKSVFADESVKMDPFEAVWAPADYMPWGVRLEAQKPAEIRKWEIEPQ